MSDLGARKEKIEKRSADIYKKMRKFQDVLRDYYNNLQLSELEKSAVRGSFRRIEDFKDKFGFFELTHDFTYVYNGQSELTISEVMWRYEEDFEYKILPQIKSIENDIEFFKEIFKDKKMIIK